MNKHRFHIAGWGSPASRMVLKLLFLQLLLKFIFVLYNYGLVADALWPLLSGLPAVLLWSVINELLVICVINLPFLVLFSFRRIREAPGWISAVLSRIMILINAGNAVLTLFDIFYFHFQRQRANADLLYVINRPWQQSFGTHPGLSILGCIFLLLLLYLIWRIIRSFLQSLKVQRSLFNLLPILAFLLLMAVIFRSDLLLPTASLRQLNTSGVSVAQNSLHSFLFSVYRNKEAQLPPVYPSAEELPGFSIRSVPFAPEEMKKKNVVLFIMESIPSAFFTPGAKHKVEMPFLDSLVQHCRYFHKAYSFGHNSNKGITSILAGLPTLTEIPLYHSAFSGLPKTGIGDALSSVGYHSAFFIGDHYDDFGFAKCCNWLGIRHYFSQESIPGYKNLPSNSMGLHDEYVMQFMLTVMDTLKQPFLSVNYNTSTHYPNDIPEAFTKRQPRDNFTPEMRSMAYYSECLRKYFEKAKKSSWYNQTLFIFCSDHWMYPDVRRLDNDVVESFHIPIFIFDPSENTRIDISYPVSQLDVSSTILGIAGVDEPVINYGQSLYLPQHLRRPYVVSKENNLLYEIMDSVNVFGYFAPTGKPEFLYNYISDPLRKINLAGDTHATLPYLENMRKFLETAVNHYRGKVAP